MSAERPVLLATLLGLWQTRHLFRSSPCGIFYHPGPLYGLPSLCLSEAEVQFMAWEEEDNQRHKEQHGVRMQLHFRPGVSWVTHAAASDDGGGERATPAASNNG